MSGDEETGDGAGVLVSVATARRLQDLDALDEVRAIARIIATRNPHMHDPGKSLLHVMRDELLRVVIDEHSAAELGAIGAALRADGHAWSADQIDRWRAVSGSARRG